MNPTPAAITAIRAYAAALSGGWAANSDAQILAAYNGATVNNPTPQGNVPVVLTQTGLAACLTDPSNGSLAKLIAWPSLQLLMGSIDADSHSEVLLWAAKLQIAGLITSGEETAIAAYVNSTVADPSWQAKVSQAQIDLGRPVDADDIATARAAQ